MEIEALEELVRRAHDSNAEVRNAALKEMRELPDEALLQLLARSQSQPILPGSHDARHLLRATPYVAFVYTIIFAIVQDPAAGWQMKQLINYVGIGLLVAFLAIAWIAYTPPRSASGHLASRPLPFSMMLLLAGRTDRRFLPYVLSELASAGTLFERTRAEGNGLYPSLSMVQSSGYTPKPYKIRQIRIRYRKLLRDMLASVGEETPALSTEQHHAFHAVLQMPEEDVDCAVSILTYLEQWGEASAVPILKRLIREDHWYVGSERVEEAARRALESIEARHQLQKQGRTLLRPSRAAEAVTPQSLLRPTAEASEQAPEQLLRPDRVSPPDESV